MRVAAIFALVLAAGTAGAAPETSPRPQPRPGYESPAPEPGAEVTSARVELPFVNPPPRPDQEAAKPAQPEKVTLVSAIGLPRSLRPLARPENLKRKNIVQVMVPVTPDLGVKTGKKGAICGMPSLQGVRLKPIAGKLKGCGVEEPVQITSVQGIPLSQAAIMDCRTAQTLDAWVKGAVVPAVGRLGGGVSRLEVAAHYACRGRNNVKGARISEHGMGHAIDISGITLKNGVTMTVLKGWTDPVQGKILKALHRAACGPFGTVLGPGSDGYHRDHLHLDTARYRSGSYCR